MLLCGPHLLLLDPYYEPHYSMVHDNTEQWPKTNPLKAADTIIKPSRGFCARGLTRPWISQEFCTRFRIPSNFGQDSGFQPKISDFTNSKISFEFQILCDKMLNAKFWLAKLLQLASKSSTKRSKLIVGLQIECAGRALPTKYPKVSWKYFLNPGF